MQDEHNQVIQKLREQYAHEAMKSKNAVLRQHSENVEALKLQMQMYREDFESERKDRERAQDHIARLEAQIRSATQQVNACEITRRYGNVVCILKANWNDIEWIV